MQRSETPLEVGRVLREHRRIALVSHYNPDADAYGSMCGLYHSLIAAGKEAICINESGVLKRYLAIPGVTEVKCTLPVGTWDALVVLDCGGRTRVGDSLLPLLDSHPLVVNIDHHASNDLFGARNYVVSTASSTAELIYDVIEAASLPVTKDVAFCLLAGIMGDTGSFRYEATSAKTFLVANKLCLAGGSPYAVTQSLFANTSFAAAKMQAKALAGMERYADGKVVEVLVDPKTYKEFGAEPEDTEVLAERARDIEGVLASCLIRFDSEIWRISLRSKGSHVDVSKVAAQFGGGGHKAAAAFRYRGDVSEILPALRKALTELVSNQ